MLVDVGGGDPVVLAGGVVDVGGTYADPVDVDGGFAVPGGLPVGGTATVLAVDGGTITVSVGNGVVSGGDATVADVIGLSTVAGGVAMIGPSGSELLRRDRTTSTTPTMPNMRAAAAITAPMTIGARLPRRGA